MRTASGVVCTDTAVFRLCSAFGARAALGLSDFGRR